MKLVKKFGGLFISKEATWQRNINLIKCILNWKVFGKTKLDTRPVIVAFCPSGNICNLKCKLCPTGERIPGRKQGMMTFKTFKTAIDELGLYLYRIHLYHWGEPFLNKDIFKMIKYARSYGIRVMMSTNLRDMDDKMARKIIDSEIDWLVISLDGASNESVIKYQKGNNFDKVFKNITDLIKLRDKLGKKLPIIEWRYIVNKHNEHEIEKAKELAKENNIRIGFLPTAPMQNANPLKTEEESFKEIKPWMSSIPKYQLYNPETGHKKDIIKECNWLWFSSTINWNGSISACCYFPEKYDFGNMLDSSFMSVWNNEKHQKGRSVIVKRSEEPTSLCQGCVNLNNQSTFF